MPAVSFSSMAAANFVHQGPKMLSGFHQGLYNIMAVVSCTSACSRARFKGCKCRRSWEGIFPTNQLCH